MGLVLDEFLLGSLGPDSVCERHLLLGAVDVLNEIWSVPGISRGSVVLGQPGELLWFVVVLVHFLLDLQLQQAAVDEIQMLLADGSIGVGFGRPCLLVGLDGLPDCWPLEQLVVW